MMWEEWFTDEVKGLPTVEEEFEEAFDLPVERTREPRPTWLRERKGHPGPCGCECTNGGFCGGCGHAGCGRR